MGRNERFLAWRALLTGSCALCLGWLAACGSSRETGGRGNSGETGLGAAGSASTSSSGGQSGAVTVTVSQAGMAPGCRRDVSLTAVTLNEPAPFDLVIVADHSESLAWSKDELSSGLRELLTNVRGRGVRVFLLTPTQYGASSAVAQRPLLGQPVVPWADPATGVAYEDAMTTYSQVCTAPDGATIECPNPLGPDPYSVVGKWSFSMPEAVAVLTADMSDSEFEAVEESLADRILSIGGTGSPFEQPLCTLSRYISQDPSLLPEHAVFLLISDEDDVSVPSECLVGFTGHVKVSKNENGSSPCSSDCDAYRFRMTGNTHYKNTSFTCAAFDDIGNRVPGSEVTKSSSQGPLNSCDGIDSGPCTEEEQQKASAFCESGTEVVSCTRECATLNEIVCSVDLRDPTVDACTSSFSMDGRSYENLAAYCATRGSGWRDCTGSGINIQYSQSLSGGSSTQSLMQGTTTAAIGEYFRTKAESVFKPEAYRVEAIGFQPSFSCKLGTGQSHALNIAKFVGDESLLFPLCESYAPALEGVLDFARALIQTEYELALEEDEDVTAVVIIDQSGHERELPKTAYIYDRDTGVLTISRDTLQSLDAKLRVEVTSDCRPIIH